MYAAGAAVRNRRKRRRAEARADGLRLLRPSAFSAVDQDRRPGQAELCQSSWGTAMAASAARAVDRPCARYFSHGSEPIPDVLTHSLTTTIGFYFGSHVTKRDEARV